LLIPVPGNEAMALTALHTDLATHPWRACRAAERSTYAKAAPDGFAAALSKGEVPPFLERIALDATPLAVYRARH
jgi:hypothetical protein